MCVREGGGGVIHMADAGATLLEVNRVGVIAHRSARVYDMGVLQAVEGALLLLRCPYSA